MSGVTRIAVLRASAIGDFVLALPALEALTRTYPSARITLLGKPWHVEFLRDRPVPVHEVLPVPRVPGVRAGTSAGGAFLEAMRSRGFDLAIQMHGGGRQSNPFVLELGARTTAGLRARDAVKLDRWLPYVPDQHEVVRCAEVVGLVGAYVERLTPRLATTPADACEARSVLPPDGRSLVVLHPGASDPRRLWPASRFAVLGDVLASEGATVAVTGTREEGGTGQAVIAAMRRPAVDLSGRLSLGGLAGLMSRAHLLVSSDTGPLHVASALGIPTVGIYWCGNFINHGPLECDLHRVAVSWRLDCPECGANCWTTTCGHARSFVGNVPVEEVVEHARDLLAAAGQWGRGTRRMVRRDGGQNMGAPLLTNES